MFGVKTHILYQKVSTPESTRPRCKPWFFRNPGFDSSYMIFAYFLTSLSFNLFLSDMKIICTRHLKIIWNNISHEAPSIIFDNIGTCEIWVNFSLSCHDGDTCSDMERTLHFELELLGYNCSLFSLLDNSFDFSE